MNIEQARAEQAKREARIRWISNVALAVALVMLGAALWLSSVHAQQMAPKVNTAEAPQRVIECSVPGPCTVTYPYGVVACDNAGTCGFHENAVAGCDRADPEFMWCLRNNSDSDMTLLPDGRVQFSPNEAMRAYVIEFDRRNPPK